MAPTTPSPTTLKSVRTLVARYEELDGSFPEELRGDALPYFFDWLTERGQLVQVTAYADDDAYVIFETRVEVGDDGVGAARPIDGSGLRGLADRVDALGGRLTVDSPGGGGTRLEAALPLPAAGGPGAAATARLIPTRSMAVGISD